MIQIDIQWLLRCEIQIQDIDAVVALKASELRFDLNKVNHGLNTYRTNHTR